MKRRRVKTAAGFVFQVPTGIYRLDGRSTRAWQLRFGEPHTTYTDTAPTRAGSAESLARAEKELGKRIARQSAPTSVKSRTVAGKGNDLPVGISGPTGRTRADKNFTEWSLQVTYPQFGRKPANKRVYIGTDSTYTDERFHAALERAIEIRERGVSTFQNQLTAANRKDARALGLKVRK